MQKSRQAKILTIVLAYAVCAALWILLSDKVVQRLFNDPMQITLASMIKGGLFVAVTSLLLYSLMRRLISHETAAEIAIAHARRLDLLAAIADSSNDAIFAKNLEGHYILFNRESARITGKSSEEILGHDDTLLFPADQAEMIMANDRVVIANARSITYQEDLSTAYGRITFLTTKSPLFDADGKAIGLLGISRDITERKQAESIIRQSEEFKRAILDSMSAQIAVLDHQGVIVAVNQPWKRFAEENGLHEPAKHCEVGVNYLEVCLRSIDPASEGALEARDGILAVLEGRLPLFGLEYPCHSSTQQRWFMMTVTPFGTGQGVVIAHTDITARKAAEEALLRQAEELAQRNAELERFNRVTVDRELDMIALKQQVNELSRRLKLEAPYPLAFLDASPATRKPGETQ